MHLSSLPIRATCLAHLIFLNLVFLITQIILDEQYRSYSSTDHATVQIIQQYRSCSSTYHTAVQIIQQYRSCSSTDHAAVQIIQQYRSYSSTDHAAVQIMQQYRSCSITDHTAVQIMQQYKSYSSTLYAILHSPVTPFLLGPNILLSTLFSNSFTLRSFFNVSDQVSHPYKTTGKIIVLYVLNFIFLDSKLEDKRFCTE
jgi:hypothetical protein